MNWWKPLGQTLGTLGQIGNRDEREGDGESSGASAQAESRTGNARRYPRVYLLGSGQAWSHLYGAELKWPDGTKTKVCDLSHSGLAFPRAEAPSLSMGDHLKLVLQLAKVGDFEVQGRIARLSDRVVALDFDALSTEARLGLVKFLEAKTIGLALRPVDPKFYKSLQDGFTHWFQGPDDTNVFLRFDELTLKAAQITMGDEVIEWRAGGESIGEVRVASFAVGSNADMQDEKVVLERVLEMLSQVRDHRTSIDPVVDALMGVANR